MKRDFLPLLLNNKIQLILLFCITVIIGLIFSDFKVVLGKDERAYLNNGIDLINNGFEKYKDFTFMSIIFYFFSYITSDNLMGAKLMYVVSLTGITFSQILFC